MQMLQECWASTVIFIGIFLSVGHIYFQVSLFFSSNFKRLDAAISFYK